MKRLAAVGLLSLLAALALVGGIRASTTDAHLDELPGLAHVETEQNQADDTSACAIIEVTLPYDGAGRLESGDCHLSWGAYQPPNYRVDPYRFYLSAPSYLTVDVDSPDAVFALTFRFVQDEDGWQAIEVNTSDLLEPGWYDVGVAGPNREDPIDYRVMIRAWTVCTVTEIGAPSSHSYSARLDNQDCDNHEDVPGRFVEIYRFHLDEETVVSIEPESSDFDLVWYLYDSSGLIHYEDNLPLQAGSYELVIATAARGESGDYRLTITAEAGCTVTEIAVPSIHTGRLGEEDCDDHEARVGSFADVYRFSLSAETVLSIRPESSDFDLVWYLYDSSGTLLTHYQNNLPLQAGSYELVITTTSQGESGDYRLALSSLMDGSCPKRQILDIEFPSSHYTELENGDCDTLLPGYYTHVYRFSLTAPTRAMIGVDGFGDDVGLILLDWAGNYIGSRLADTHRYHRLEAYIVHSLQPGSYQAIVVSGYRSDYRWAHADYELVLTAAVGVCPERHIVDTELPVTRSSGRLQSEDCETGIVDNERGYYSDVYRFNLSVPTEVTILIQSDDFTPHLGLLDGTGDFIDLRDERYTFFNSEFYVLLYPKDIVVRTLQPGSYQLIVTTDWPNETGDYRLTVKADIDCSIVDVAAPSTHSGSLTDDDCFDPSTHHLTDYYRFLLSDPAHVTIDLESSEFNPYLRLFDERSQIGWDDGGIGQVSQIRRILRSGWYVIAATTSDWQGRDSGSYRLEISTIPGIVLQREALIALYEAAGGDEWKDSEGWLSDEPLGEWHGVNTDSAGNVIALQLINNGLSGTIPAELANLVELGVLNLSGNQLSGAIPSELGNLSNLQGLNLRGNRLGGEIPASLGELRNLTHFYLSDNELSGPLPAELGQLINLQTLDLHDNQLEGAVPAALGQLTELTELSLQENSLCLPPALHDDPLLEGLPDCGAEERLALEQFYDYTNGEGWTNSEGWLSDEPLGDWYGVTTNEDGFVIGLDLHNNNLRGQVASNLHRFLPKLQWIRIEGNALTGCFPSGLAEALLYGESAPTENESSFLQSAGRQMAITGALTLLDVLGGKKQSKVLGGIMSQEEALTRTFQYSILKTLKLPICMVPTPEPIYPLATQSSETDKEILLAVKDYFIEQCETSMSASGGDDCERRGKFETWKEEDWGQKKWNRRHKWEGVELTDGRVTRLSLDNRQLQGQIPEVLGSLGELTFLNLSRNNLSGPIPAQLGNLTKLRTLALNDNRLSGTIPAALNNLIPLEELYLYNNRLTGRIPLELSTLSYSNLRKMDLDREGDYAVGGCLPPNPNFVQTEFLAGLADTVATTTATWSVGSIKLAGRGVLKLANTVRVSDNAATYAAGVVNLANAVGNAAKRLQAATPVTAKFVENFSVAITENILGAFAGPAGKGFILDIAISEKIAEVISRVTRYFNIELGGEIDMGKVYCTD